MSREKEGFRDNLQRLDERFPDKEMLTISDVARFEGSSRDWVRSHYVFNKFGRLSKVDYARQVSV